MSNDTELLRRYVEERSESAFGELVREHLNLVYASALRETSGDSGLAEDLSQMVFKIGRASCRERVSCCV